MNRVITNLSPKTKAILCIIFSAFCFTWMNIFVRLSGDLPSFQKSFFRNLVAAGVALLMILRKHESVKPQKKNIPLLLLRATFGTIGILCNFYAVDHLVLSNASMLNKMSPFFILVFSFLILKEKLNLVQILVVLVAFVGSLFVIKPTPANMDLMPSAIGFAGGVSAGLAYTLVRKLGLRGERGPVIVLFFSAFSCLVVVPWLIFNAVAMTWQQWLFLLAAGVTAAGGQFGVTTAYTYAPGREVSVYDYTQIIFSAMFGFFLFGDIPDGWSILGYVLIIGAALMLFLYNNRKPELKA